MDVSRSSIDAEAQCEFDVKGVLGMDESEGDIKNVLLTLTVYSDDNPE